MTIQPKKPLTFQQATRRLPRARSKREVLLAVYHADHTNFHAAHDELSVAFRALSRSAAELRRNQAIIDSLRSIVDLGPAAPPPEEKIVDAPLMTDAEFLHQKEKNPDMENVGKSKARFSMDEYIGGFSRYPNREAHHEMAAARFLSLYERGQIGGARATDYSAPYVDKSGPSQDGALVAGDEARREYRAMKLAIGDGAENLLERVIVGRVSARTIATQRAGEAGATGRLVSMVAQEVKDALEAAALHFRFGKTAGHRGHYVDEAARRARGDAKSPGVRGLRGRASINENKTSAK